MQRLEEVIGYVIWNTYFDPKSNGCRDFDFTTVKNSRLLLTHFRYNTAQQQRINVKVSVTS